MNKTGDTVSFRGSSKTYRLMGVSLDGIVQADLAGAIITTDESEIAHNYTEAARKRAQANGIPYAEQAAIDSAPAEFRAHWDELVESDKL